ncbi:MAG TPA: hypothetical protein VFZ64_02230 [Nocardioidaceae bacterium]
MDLTDPAQREAWRRHLSGVVTGRKVVCGVMPLAAMNDLVPLLAEAGASKPLLLHSSPGAGPTVTENDAYLMHVEVTPHRTMSEELRGLDRLVRTLPAAVRERIDAYDPEREAAWFVGPFASTAPIDGREVLGGREPAWTALEDKTTVDELWDAVGHPRSPREVVDLSPALLGGVSDGLDQGMGVVWVADARDGFNGGGEFTRWVVTPEERARALAFFAPRCDSVRVMPFLEGVPCSIHGFVLPSGTAAMRPVELAIMRGEGRRFVYGGQGTSWDPPAEGRAEMRDLVRRTGELLRERVGYRGAFGIDGVMTADGFRPTELNPRFAGGLATLARTLDPGLFHLLQLSLTAGRDPSVTCEELEAWALPALDAARTVQPRALSWQRVAEDSTEIAVGWDGERLHHDPDGGMRLLVGPSPVGTFAKLDLLDGATFTDRVGVLNAAMMRFLDDELGTDFGLVEPAPDVRT